MAASTTRTTTAYGQSWQASPSGHGDDDDGDMHIDIFDNDDGVRRLLETHDDEAADHHLHRLEHSDELAPHFQSNVEWNPPSPYAETEDGDNSLFHSHAEEQDDTGAVVDEESRRRASRPFPLIPKTDTLFALLYYACAATMLFLGIALLCTSARTRSVTDPRKTSRVLLLIYESSGVLAVMVSLSTILGAFWILLLGACVKQIVWGTIMFIPASCFGLSMWASVLLLSPPVDSAASVPASYSQITFLVILLLTTTVSGAAFSIFAYLQRGRIETTVSIIRLATEILSANPHIFTLSLGILGGYVLFVVVWVAFVARLVQMTAVVSLLDKAIAGQGTWLEGLQFTPMLLFFVFMLLWTTCLFANVHRMTIAGIVHHWYFHRHTPSHVTGGARAKWALRRTATELFGTACFGGLVLTAVQASQIAHSVYRKHLRKSVPLPDVPALLTSITAYLGRILMVINHYTLIYAAITGHSFITSARNSTRLFQRTLVEALIRDLFTRAILLLGNVILCGFVGMAMVSLVRRDQVGDNGTAWIVVIGMWISWGVMRFWGEVMVNVIDSTFMCYAIDMDNKTCHSNLAHTAFGRKPLNVSALLAFMARFSFQTLNLVAGLRLLSSKLLLRAESQVLDRVIAAFSEAYVRCQRESPSHFTYANDEGLYEDERSLWLMLKSRAVDVVHQISFSIVLLNTDLHNPANDTRMTKKQFVKNTLSSIQSLVVVGTDANATREWQAFQPRFETLLSQIYKSLRQTQLPQSAPSQSRPTSAASAATIAKGSPLRLTLERNPSNHSSVSVRSSGSWKRGEVDNDFYNDRKSFDSLRTLDRDISVPPDTVKCDRLVRKHLLTSKGRSPHRSWKSVHLVLTPMTLQMVTSRSVQNVQLSNIHNVATTFSGLPNVNYVCQRGNVWSLQTDDNSLYLFECASMALRDSWIATVNYWNARWSRTGRGGGVTSYRYGWENDLGPDDRLSVWMPPASTLVPSDLNETEQQAALDAQLKATEQALESHIHALMRTETILSASPTRMAVARGNWKLRLEYLNREIVKWRTYAHAFRQGPPVQSPMLSAAALPGSPNAATEVHSVGHSPPMPKLLPIPNGNSVSEWSSPTLQHGQLSMSQSFESEVWRSLSGQEETEDGADSILDI
ncbi:hypothetical protein RI367_003689 [Sorochytrium milnesiophthora]